MASEQQPAASWGADTDGRLNQPSEHLTHHAMWQTDASGNVTGLVGPGGEVFPWDKYSGVTSLEKIGVMLEVGTGGQWDESIVESPCVLFDDATNLYVMFYHGYTSGDVAAIGYATSPSPSGPWTKYASNPILEASGSGADAAGVGGAVCIKENGIYYLYYIGFTEVGYEAGTKSMMLATATDISGPWTRQGQIISPSGTGWRKTAIYHPSIVKSGSLYYCFFNAKGDTPGGNDVETIGYATANSLLGQWSVQDANCPLLDVVPATWESTIVGDPSVWFDGDKWIMTYYGYNGAGHAVDGVAVTTKDAFPLGWTRFTGNPVLVYTPYSNIDGVHAHKPYVINTEGNHYHYYTAKGDSGIRSIACAWSGPPRPFASLQLPEATRSITTDASVAQSTVIFDCRKYGLEMRLIVRANPGGNTMTCYVNGFSGANSATLQCTGSSWANFYSPWIRVPYSANAYDAIYTRAVMNTGTGIIGQLAYEFKWTKNNKYLQ